MKTITESLTPYPEGSTRELCHLALPLMLTALSGSLMLVLDRIILGQFSTSAMNAAATVGMLCAIFQYGAMGISSIAEVFVGQYNGAKKHAQLGEPAWQMIWFSLLTFIVFIPLAFFSPKILIAEQVYDEGLPYFQWLMAFGPTLAIIAALSAFFIGHGKTKLILVTTILANLTNAILDYFLIFGVEGLLLPMGTTGAAIATVISELLEVIILGFFFLNHHNRKTYGTNKWQFKSSTFLSCLKIGTPNAVGHIFEISAWSLVFSLLTGVGKDHLTVFTICQSILLLFLFTTDGMQKAIITLAANFIGSKKTTLVPTLLKSALIVQVYLSIVIAIPLILFPGLLINTFISTESPPENLTYIIGQIKIAFVWVLGFRFFDGIVWIYAGILTAGGDTKFIMVMNAISAWAFIILPFYFLIVYGGGSPQLAVFITFLYSVGNAACFYLRYKTHKWKSLRVIQSSKEIINA